MPSHTRPSNYKSKVRGPGVKAVHCPLLIKVCLGARAINTRPSNYKSRSSSKKGEEIVARSNREASLNWLPMLLKYGQILHASLWDSTFNNAFGVVIQFETVQFI